MTEAKPELSQWCPECGPFAGADEDGCCGLCGATMIRWEIFQQIIAAERERCARVAGSHAKSHSDLVNEAKKNGLEELVAGHCQAMLSAESVAKKIREGS